MGYYKHMIFNLVSHVDERSLNTIVTLQIVNTIGIMRTVMEAKEKSLEFKKMITKKRVRK